MSRTSRAFPSICLARLVGSLSSEYSGPWPEVFLIRSKIESNLWRSSSSTSALVCVVSYTAECILRIDFLYCRGVRLLALLIEIFVQISLILFQLFSEKSRRLPFWFDQLFRKPRPGLVRHLPLHLSAGLLRAQWPVMILTGFPSCHHLRRLPGVQSSVSFQVELSWDHLFHLVKHDK